LRRWIKQVNKMSETRQVNLDTEAARRLAHREATMAKVPSHSVGMALLKFKEIYFGNVKKNLDSVLNICYLETKEEIRAKSKEILTFDESEKKLLIASDYKAACSYLKKSANEPCNALDTVTLFINGKDEPYQFRLQDVITFAWKAINDYSKYLDHVDERIRLNPELKKAIEQDASLSESIIKNVTEQLHRGRLIDFFNCIEKMRLDNVCHHGKRHELIFPFSFVYPGIEIIEDEKATVSRFLKENLTISYQEADESIKDKCKDAMLLWITEHDPKKLLCLLNPEDTFRSSIHQLFIQHGINPVEINADKLIDDALKHIELSCDKNLNPGLYYACQLFHQLREHLNQDQANQALKIACNWVSSASFDFNHQEQINLLGKFCEIYKAHEAWIKYRDGLKTSGLLSDSIIEFSHEINLYFLAIITENKLAVDYIYDADIKIEFLMNKIDQHKKNSRQDEIENFFWKYFNSQTIEGKSAQYKLLLDEDFKSKICMSEDKISELYRSNTSDGYLDITVYDINRCILYAITTPPFQWPANFGGVLSASSSKLESGLFPRIIHLLQHLKESQNRNHLQLKNESYPPPLIKQLIYLREEYRKNLWAQLSEEEKIIRKPLDIRNDNMRPGYVILTPDQVKSDSEWCYVSRLIKSISNYNDPSAGERLLESIYDRYAVKINTLLITTDVTDALNSIPSSRHDSYKAGYAATINRLSDAKLKEIIFCFIDLRNILCKLSHVEQSILIHRLGNHIKNIIRYYDHLMIVFRALTHLPNRNLLIQILDDQLDNYIKSNFELANILTLLDPNDYPDSMERFIDRYIKSDSELLNVILKLPDETRINLLKKIGNKLKKIVLSALSLTQILIGIPREDRKVLIQLLNEKLITIIENGKGLSSILKLLCDDARKKLMQLLGVKVRDIIQNGDQLDDILMYLRYEECKKLMFILGDKVKDIITYNAWQFISLLSKLSQENQEDLIKRLDTRLVDIFINTDHLKNALQVLSQQNGLLLLQQFGEQLGKIIQTEYQLRMLFEHFHQDNYPALMQLLGHHVNKIIETDLDEVFEYLLHKKHRAVLLALDSKVKIFVTEYHEFCRLFNRLHRKNRLVLINLLDDPHNSIKSIFQSADQLNAILNRLPREDRHILIKALGDRLKHLMYNDYQVIRILKKLPSEHHLDFIKEVDNELKVIIVDDIQLFKLLKQLTPINCCAVIKILDDKIIDIIKDTDSLEKFRFLSPEIFYMVAHALLIKDQIEIENKFNTSGLSKNSFFNKHLTIHADDHFSKEQKTASLNALFNAVINYVSDKNAFDHISDIDLRPLTKGNLNKIYQTVCTNFNIAPRKPKPEPNQLRNRCRRTINSMVHFNQSITPSIRGH